MTRTRSWILTLNNPTDEEIASLATACGGGGVLRATVAHEVGEGGTPHLQGFIQLAHGKTVSAFKRWAGSNRYHLETARDLRRSWDYCRKGEQPKTEWEEQNVDGPTYGLNHVDVLTTGDRPPESPEDSWGQAVAMIEDGSPVLEVVRRFPGFARSISALLRLEAEVATQKTREWRHLTTTYVWGATGVGKTRAVMEGHGYDNVYRVTNWKHPWDGYRGQPVIIFDEFRSQPTMSQMLNWLDGYPIDLPARYQDRPAEFTEVYIISNWPLHDQYTGKQETSPETWRAFMRRIHGCFRVDEEGSYHAQPFAELGKPSQPQKSDEEE